VGTASLTVDMRTSCLCYIATSAPGLIDANELFCSFLRTLFENDLYDTEQKGIKVPILAVSNNLHLYGKQALLVTRVPFSSFIGYSLALLIVSSFFG